MASYSQLPGVLNFYVKAQDHFSTVIDFDANLADTFVYASVNSLVTGESIASFNVSYIDETLGQISLSLTGTQTGNIAPGSYSWALYWMPPSGDRRSAIGGVLEVTK